MSPTENPSVGFSSVACFLVSNPPADGKNKRQGKDENRDDNAEPWEQATGHLQCQLGGLVHLRANASV
jgi:hypothetical protein